MKKLLGFVLGACVSLGLCISADAAASTAPTQVSAKPAVTKHYVKSTTLNVRTGMTTKHKVMGKLSRGQAVAVKKDMRNGWLQISYKGKTGYTSKAHIVSVVPKTITVEATSYTPFESTRGITAMGFNIKRNPKMKLIAVDPRIIPLGTKVWVEGYGEAIAGDTGGAIKGKRIDILLPTKREAFKWGRKHVKVRIL
ncbi:3D domain-containing protein [Ectobacillus ponti]|uniref:3D domain-containing protein n=1 Tax=Ectobacillus ponti TaxID=2961894 RepID=UPI0024468036|nr:3D domain-containing protein [Ectobacillus ponti]